MYGCGIRRISKSGELQILMLRVVSFFMMFDFHFWLFCYLYFWCWYRLLQSINLVLYEFFQISTRMTEEWNLKKMHNGRQIR